ncbi:MAG: hypothetical protein JSW47_00360 [Phycisphaerales bacterium]|nr:MAG: hypothetical protein JSW47_00360 [Phycisphaerales bacterium]
MDDLIVIGILMAIGVFIYISSRQRPGAMASVAARLGLSFDPGKNRQIAQRYSFLEKLRKGSAYNVMSKGYAYNTISGSFRGYDVTAFDYHYETGEETEYGLDDFSLFTLHLPAVFPELLIGPEGVFSKIAQAVGYDDIDFESHEFSRKFFVRSGDKKFAYDVCNARMIEYLLANRDFSIEIEDDVLAIWFRHRLAPESIEPNLNRLITVRSLMPDYLFSGR